MNQATAGAAHFFLQLVVILGACALMRSLMRRIGQSPVVGEMIAGVLLGPSLLGAIAPGAATWIFAKGDKPVLYAVASLGLTLYMFVVGLEFRVDLFRSQLRKAAAVSAAGILVPFLLACGIAFWLVREGGYFTPVVGAPMACLFIGAALSITAFPMLARIIIEHGLSGSTVGTIALAAGSMDDAAAWALLATVLGCISHDLRLVVAALGGGLVYAGFCLFIIRPLLRGRFTDPSRPESLALLMLLLAIGAWVTDMIGLYSVFGAFILGLSIPRGDPAEKTASIVSPLTVSVLLPFFFTYSGLNTCIGLLDTLHLWCVCVVLILAAVLGKLLACYGAARFSGVAHGDALTIASLMNARGLMELILLNIGLQAGIITQTLFTMLVLMAVVTTLMAAPGFNAAKRSSANSC
jgi:Kef-type K+ transport system membrane component KefB